MACCELMRLRIDIVSHNFHLNDCIINNSYKVNLSKLDEALMSKMNRFLSKSRQKYPTKFDAAGLGKLWLEKCIGNVRSEIICQ